MTQQYISSLYFLRLVFLAPIALPFPLTLFFSPFACFLSIFPSGPICSACVDNFGARPVTIFSGVMVAGGLMLSAFAPNVQFLIFSYGIVVGKPSCFFYFCFFFNQVFIYILFILFFFREMTSVKRSNSLAFLKSFSSPGVRP